MKTSISNLLVASRLKLSLSALACLAVLPIALARGGDASVRIVGGANAAQSEFPFLVSLQELGAHRRSLRDRHRLDVRAPGRDGPS
jgi:secreted trypsin-like serine protease